MTLGAALLILLLCVQVSRIRVLEASSGALMSGEVISFTVFRAGKMGVGSEVTALRGNLL